MVRLVSVLGRACVGIPGLMFFDLLTILLNFRFLRTLDFFPRDFDASRLDDFSRIASPVALRLVTVGVIILERHAALEITGEIPKGADRDALSEKLHPFGVFFLVFGLLMECVVEQVMLPITLFNRSVLISIVVWISYIVAVISLMAALQVLQILVAEWRAARSQR